MRVQHSGDPQDERRNEPTHLHPLAKRYNIDKNTIDRIRLENERQQRLSALPTGAPFQNLFAGFVVACVPLASVLFFSNCFFDFTLGERSKPAKLICLATVSALLAKLLYKDWKEESEKAKRWSAVMQAPPHASRAEIE